jgi:hypothetical protein
MAQRGGPWRLAGDAMTDGRAARGSSGMLDVAARDGERVLRWSVSVYVLAVVSGILIALVGLSEGWWSAWSGVGGGPSGDTVVGRPWRCGTRCSLSPTLAA